MKFMRIGPVGLELPVVRDGDRYLDLSPLTDDIDGDFLADDPVTRASVTLGDLAEVDGAADLRIGAPIALVGDHSSGSGIEPSAISSRLLHRD